MIYFIQAGKNGPIKIGHTESDIASRMAQLQTGCPYELKLLWTIHGNQEKEAEIHSDFEEERIRGEWFHPSEMLLEYIEIDATNQWVFDFEGKFVDITERRNMISVGSDGGWWVEEPKKGDKLCLNINAQVEVNLDLMGVREKYKIEIHGAGVGIKAVDPNSTFRPVYILLSGEKVVTKDES